MTGKETLDYVKAAAAALSLPLDEVQAQRVAMHLGRTAALAEQLDALDLGVHQEPAEIYSPLVPQPAQDGRQ